MKPLTIGYIRQVMNGEILQGSDDLRIQYGAYRLKQVRHSHTILFLKGKIIKWDRLKPFFPIAIVAEEFMQTSEYEQSITIIKVENLEKAYWEFINDYRDSIDIPIIAVTGTSGKTSTKEMIKHLLMVNRKITFTNSTNNSRTVHLANLLSIDETTEAAVFEAAVGAPNDILKAAAYLKPTIGIITNIGEHHLNHCKTLEAYIAAKGEMISSLQLNGILILNEDDEKTKKLDREQFAGKILTFGIQNTCDYRASNLEYSTNGMNFTLEHDEQKYQMYVPGLGEHQVYNALAAIVAVRQIGMDFTAIKDRLVSFETFNRQMQVSNGPNGSTIIDDSWSITTTSLKAALKVLESVGKNKKKIAVVGTITDLGSWGYVIHELAGEIIASSDVDVLITIGMHAKIIGITAKKINQTMEVYSYKNHICVYPFLKNIVDPTTVVLIKGDMYSEPINKLSMLLRKKYN
ncbi:UDP-N-acetylmuramoyl-tripeptide--D-alanyl-D-alanine ligase [Sporosarcina highlanderae]|uniref:Mur ligase family protein n=1 Tax=Sporosarcina highlanderae TaxID=3035916 RepID=A0ABT8JST3_9BACL|nr:Mur ligase family protein [Sporosarcina highlanderae]MDN4607591.1 Mur ligase family protein [Sporosarcina highlanderae]